MNYVFISGIPTSGKSYLAEQVAKRLNIAHIKTDDLRDEMREDQVLKKWVDFYWNLDEKNYLLNTSCDNQWLDLVKQAEAFWPTILKKINEVLKNSDGAIFEGVDILPHLATKDLSFKGIYLLGNSQQTIFDRLQKESRWGDTMELKLLEAAYFWNCERVKYELEAKKYGYKSFTNNLDAERELLSLLT